MMGELLRASAVGAAFLAIFAAAEIWRRLAAPPVEWTRKLVHFAGGAVVAAFPWIFQSPWSVLGLALGFGAILWGTRRLGFLQSVHGIERHSEGGLFYPLAIVVLFALAHGQPVFYVIAVLALIVSDTAAALLGSTYGRTIYDVETDRRSMEGSAAFFLTTFLAVHLPLLLWTDVDRGASVLVGLQIALVVTLFEGVSLRGSDNLLVPLVTYYLLRKLTPEPVPFLVEQLTAQLLIVGTIGFFAWRFRLLKTSGAMATMLFFYGTHLLGGPAWLLAPTLGLVGFVALRGWLRNTGTVPEAEYQVLATFYISVVAVVLLIAHDVAGSLFENAWPGEGSAFYPAFIGAATAQLGIIFSTQFEPFGVHSSAPPLSKVLVPAASALAILGPLGLWVGASLSPWTFGVVTAITFLGAGFYWLGRMAKRWPARPPWNVRLQATSVAVATGIVLSVHLLHLANQ